MIAITTEKGDKLALPVLPPAPESVFQDGIAGISPFSQMLNKGQESRPQSWVPEVTITASSRQNHVDLNTKILSFSMN